MLLISITAVWIGVVGFMVTFPISMITLGPAGSSDGAVALASGLGQLALRP